MKIVFLCGKSGLVYDFILYQGAATELSEQSKKRMGHGAALILHLSHRICDPNHKLNMDNYFMTYHVLEVLAEKKIHAAGTARACRFTKPPLMDDKAMSKRRGGIMTRSQALMGKLLWSNGLTTALSCWPPTLLGWETQMKW
ncbi:hypothetical protein AAFF_G00184140 [Aldrovandia affinis]|uniref:PiggyBac transposable element-derived protein domain-containing protein n=1 Tax=Aldrovandia affinis TaxID=143900 RepID=A0AAD7W6I6_9TELE|nr:hypothetical protein AAFF_G00184140 [Aldrovandia affinis]